MWRGLLGVAGVALFFLGAVYVWTHFILKDETERSTVNEALVYFHRELKRNHRYAKHHPQTPAFGVYRYRTRGGENLDTAALSAGHDYDGFSTTALTPIPCGVRERWQVLVERWTEGNLCLGADTTHVVAVTEFHEFFGTSKLTRYTCKGGTTRYTAELRKGMSWSSQCTSEKGTVTSHSRVVGIEPVTVDGRTYSAAHVSARAELSGDPDGSARQDSWLRRTDGLLLKRTSHTDAHVDTTGGGNFTESYSLRLISMRPQR